MSDRMVVMNKGKIEEMGAADEIYNNPQQDYTKRLINAIPKGELEHIRQRITNLQPSI
jgi:peptide/nickel transport system ATP-binding protein